MDFRYFENFPKKFGKSGTEFTVKERVFLNENSLKTWFPKNEKNTENQEIYRNSKKGVFFK